MCLVLRSDNICCRLLVPVPIHYHEDAVFRGVDIKLHTFFTLELQNRFMQEPNFARRMVSFKAGLNVIVMRKIPSPSQGRHNILKLCFST
jgi:hypothetical protein